MGQRSWGWGNQGTGCGRFRANGWVSLELWASPLPGKSGVICFQPLVQDSHAHDPPSPRRRNRCYRSGCPTNRRPWPGDGGDHDGQQGLGTAAGRPAHHSRHRLAGGFLMRVLLARHGETPWNAEGRYQGQMDIALSPVGEAQAAKLGARLADVAITRAIASPLARARRTAELALGASRAPLIGFDPDLQEIAHGEWEGLLASEIRERDPALLQAWRDAPESVQMPGGESIGDVAARAWPAFVRATEGLGADDTLLVVAHDAVNRVLAVPDPRPAAVAPVVVPAGADDDQPARRPRRRAPRGRSPERLQSPHGVVWRGSASGALAGHPPHHGGRGGAGAMVRCFSTVRSNRTNAIV